MNVAALERRIARAEAALVSNTGRTAPDYDTEFSDYAPGHLKIRTKTGGIDPFVFNRASRELRPA